MKKRCLAAIAALIMLMTVFSAAGAMPAAAEAASRPVYLKSATYYSDDWVANFWNSESRNMDMELEKIAADGFNSIILAVPWREFQPDMRRYTYNQYAFSKLDRVMTAAAAHDLWVVLRLGYTWDYLDPGEPASKRYEALVCDDWAVRAWMDYAKTVYQAASSHANFYGGFITWEDFWDFTYTATAKTGRFAARQRAESCGYTTYMKKNYTLAAINEIYQEDFRSYDDVYLPEKTHPAEKLFYDFYDEFLYNLLLRTQKVFPGLSMEVRLDGELLYDAEGEPYLYRHEATYPCGDAGYTAAMFSIAMGQKNKGERVSGAQAAAASAGYLRDVSGLTGGKKIYLEQLLFTDNTPGFEFNAQVKSDQLGDYLIRMIPVLREHTMGYGVWTYRDYGNNQLYNPQFALGMAGWLCEGSVRSSVRDGSPAAALADGAQIRQSFNGGLDPSGRGTITVRFHADSDGPAVLEVGIGQVREMIEIDGGKDYVLEYPGVKASKIMFRSRGGTVYLDDIKVYDHVQEGHLYDMEGRELDCIDEVRRVNAELP